MITEINTWPWLTELSRDEGRPVRRWRPTDPTHAVFYDRSGDDLVNGLYVELAGWDRQVWRTDPVGVEPVDQPGTNGGDG